MENVVSVAIQLGMHEICFTDHVDYGIKRDKILRRAMTLQMTRRKKQRMKYTITFVLLLLIEVLIALYVHDSFIRPYVGDMLVVIVLYCFIRIFIPNKFSLLPLYIFLFAAGVEILQYFKLVQILGLENNTFLRVLIGSVFDWKDIVSYGVGCAILGVIQGKSIFRE